MFFRLNFIHNFFFSGPNSVVRLIKNWQRIKTYNRIKPLESFSLNIEAHKSYTSIQLFNYGNYMANFVSIYS